MGVPGALDWQAQIAQTLRLIKTATPTITTPQSIDITSVVGPNAQGLTMFWVAALANTGQACAVQVGDGLNDVAFNSLAELPDGGVLTVPFFGSIFTLGGGHTATVTVQRLSGDPSPLNGTLYIFENTAPVTVIPTTRRDQIGQGQTTGQVNIAGSSTQTLLAAPPTGMYYRIKGIGWTTVAAPASTNRVQVQRLSSGDTLFSFVVTAVANQTINNFFDIELDEGIKVNNAVTSTLPMTCMYELWRA